jgi:hypothetical protein
MIPNLLNKLFADVYFSHLANNRKHVPRNNEDPPNAQGPQYPGVSDDAVLSRIAPVIGVPVRPAKLMQNNTMPNQVPATPGLGANEATAAGKMDT